jgi:hypothetical protein
MFFFRLLTLCSTRDGAFVIVSSDSLFKGMEKGGLVGVWKEDRLTVRF